MIKKFDLPISDPAVLCLSNVESDPLQELFSLSHSVVYGTEKQMMFKRP